ncbi:hypothetical protein Tco_0341029 [Tanacetum coccineum]
MKLNLEARLMGETLVLNRSLDPLYKDYIESNDLNVPLELRREQVDDLMPTIEEVLKIWNPYLDERMGEVVVREPFCKALCVETRRFEGIITIRDKDDSVTYQMVVNSKDLAGKKIETTDVGGVSLTLESYGYRPTLSRPRPDAVAESLTPQVYGAGGRPLEYQYRGSQYVQSGVKTEAYEEAPLKAFTGPR